MDLVQETGPETLAFLAERGVRVEVLDTLAAVAHVNELARSERVGGLFHSTC